MDKKYLITYSEKVFDDLNSIPPQVAEKILDMIQHLAVFPEIGMEVQSKYWSGYQFFAENYRILYRIFEDRKVIEIYHIRHGKRLFH